MHGGPPTSRTLPYTTWWDSPSGGMLVTSDANLARRTRQLLVPTDGYADQLPEVPTYEYALSPLLAAVGRGQLRVLDARVARRRESPPPVPRWTPGLPVSLRRTWQRGDGTRWLTCLTFDTAGRADDATQVQASLSEARSRAVPSGTRSSFSPASERTGLSVATSGSPWGNEASAFRQGEA